MMFPMFRRRSRQDTISTLYSTIVAQARLPRFYREYGVADTVNGRFDLLVLHLATVLDRLAEDVELRNTGQALFNRFCQDMDHNLREMGIGDLSVPKDGYRRSFGPKRDAPHRGGILWTGTGLSERAGGTGYGVAGRGFDEKCLRRHVRCSGCARPPCSPY